MSWQPENLTAQIDGVTATFTTTFQRVLGQLIIHHNGNRVVEALFSEPNSKQITLTFVPALLDTLHIQYLTDTTIEGRVVGFAQDPGTAPPIPQSLTDALDALDNRLDALELTAPSRRDAKESARVASTANVIGVYSATGGPAGSGQLTGMPAAIDGVTLVPADTILLKDQTAQDQNGPWFVTSVAGVWDRAPDFDTSLDVTQGARLVVIEGVTNAGTAWVLTTPDPVTVGGVSGSNLVWAQTSSAGGGGGGPSGGSGVTRAFAPGALLRDVVYLRADGIADRASATTVITGIAAGFIETLNAPVAGQALVRFSGDLSGFAGLIPGRLYVLGKAPGSIVEETDTANPNYPDTTPQSGHIILEVGVAVSATTLFVSTNRDFIEF